MVLRVALFGLLALACGGGSPAVAPPPPPAPPQPPPGAALVDRVATVPVTDLVELVAGTDGWWAAGRNGRIWHIAHDGTTRVLVEPASDRDLEDFAVAGDRLHWATGDGLRSAGLDGGDPTVLTQQPVHAVVRAGAGVCWATHTQVWCQRAGAAPEVVVPDAHVWSPDELAATDAWVAWADHGGRTVQVLDRSTGAVHGLGTYRGPHSLTADEHAVYWVESEADLLPGRSSATYRALQRGATWFVAPIGLDASMRQIVAVDGCLYSAASCGRPDDSEWTRFDLGAGSAPVAVGTDRFTWSTYEREEGARALRSAPRSACCQER